MTSTTGSDAFSAQSWPVRLLRAFAGAGASLLLALGGHRLGGGDISSTPLLVLAFAGIFAVAFLVAGKRVTTGQIVGLLLIGQIVVHAACMAGSAPMAFGSAMLFSHLLATAAATAVLRRGETFVWALADRLGLRRLALLFASNPAPVRARLAPARDHPPLRRAALVGGVGLRGPPAGLC